MIRMTRMNTNKDIIKTATKSQRHQETQKKMKLFAGLCGLVPSCRSIQLTTSIFIFLMSSTGLSAQGPERIISYDSRIELLEDGSMAVTEQIQVVSTGDLIKRGIYRDFPTRYKSRGGKWIVVRFDVIQVLRDGQTEDYHMENHSNGKRVYIGNKDVFLDPGVYTYTIAYRTDRQLGFFRYHDELYWNVTGNGWEFDIERASATLILPKSIRGQIMEYDGYTGSQGARGKKFHA